MKIAWYIWIIFGFTIGEAIGYWFGERNQKMKQKREEKLKKEMEGFYYINNTVKMEDLQYCTPIISYWIKNKYGI